MAKNVIKNVAKKVAKKAMKNTAISGAVETVAGTAKTLKGVSKIARAGAEFVGNHPKLSTRLYGATQLVSGLHNLKAYKNTADKAKLVQGLIKTIGGGALVILNDRAWYEKLKKITPAYNPNRPMNPVLITDITKDATAAGITKLSDIYLNWKSVYDSLVLDSVSTQYMKKIREELRSNLTYNEQLVKDYIHDTIGITIAMCQISKQMNYRDFLLPDNPILNQAMNQVPTGVTNYGPVELVQLEAYTNERFADTIIAWDTLVSLTKGSLQLPADVAKFITFYFGNMYSSDSDFTNAQLINPRIRQVFLKINAESVQGIDITTLNPNDWIEIVNAFNKKYAIIMADIDKTGLMTPIEFTYHREMNPAPVYSVEFIQAILNAYTSNKAVTEDGFIRLDMLDEAVDPLTTFVMLGSLQNENSPVYIPSIRVESMVLKFISDDTLEWGDDLFQGSFDTSKPFGLAINSDLIKDVYTNVSIDATTDVLPTVRATIPAGSTSLVVSTTTDNVDAHYVSYYGNARINADNSDRDSTKLYFYTPVGAYELDNSNYVIVQIDAYSVKTREYMETSYITLNAGTYGELLQGSYNQSNLGYSLYYKLGATAGTPGQITVNRRPWLTGNINHQASGHYLVDTRYQDGEVIITFPSIGTFIGKTFTYYPNNTSVSSVTDVSAVTTDTVENSSYTTAGYITYDSFIADQCDYHIPMMVESRVTVTVNGAVEHKDVLGKSLIKENYIPFMYQVKDLDSVLYDMYTSLFTVPGLYS